MEAAFPETDFATRIVDAMSLVSRQAHCSVNRALVSGTGRVAVPLHRRGVRVHGIELSPAMVAALRAKPGTEQIGVTIGDFATTRIDTSFRLVYLARNTITNLTTQDEQVECFE